jgi:hypothetical protein
MSELVSQIILFLFGLIAILFSFSLAEAGETWMVVGMFCGSATFLITLAGIGPYTIQNFVAKWSKKGFQLELVRHQATKEEQEIAIKLAQDNPPPEIEKEGQKFIEKAEERSPEKRSAEDYLALAADKWRAKDYDAALEDVYAGLALKPEEIRIKASLIGGKGLILMTLGLTRKPKSYIKKRFKLIRNPISIITI